MKRMIPVYVLLLAMLVVGIRIMVEVQGIRGEIREMTADASLEQPMKSQAVRVIVMK